MGKDISEFQYHCYMNDITVAIIEDEKPAARLLENMIRQLRPEWKVVQVPGSIEEAVKWFASNPHPDILFLDIQLSDGNSFLFVEQAMPESLIIFTTAYDEYAVRAFSVNSIDYLLKPVRLERLESAILKFERLKGMHPGGTGLGNVLDTLKDMLNPGKKYRTRFLIDCNDRFITLPVSDVAFFYSRNKITFATATSGREYAVDLSLDRLVEQLDPDKFFRTNRQSIVNMEAITRVEPYFQGKLVVHTRPECPEKIIVSKEKQMLFKMWLNY